MYHHLGLFLFLLCLIIGTWAVITSHQCYKLYRFPFFRRLVGYLVVQNLAIFMILVGKYIRINFPESPLTDHRGPFYTLVLLFFIMAVTGWIYFYIRFILDLKEAKPSRRQKWSGMTSLTLIGILMVIGVTIFLTTGSNLFIDTTYRSLLFAAAGCFLFLSIHLILEKKNDKNNRYKPIKWFGAMSLVGYALFFSCQILPRQIEPLATCLGFMVLNFVPIVWIRKAFLPHYIESSASVNRRRMESFIKEYHISNREWEIIDLVIQGKSNKEIEDVLFISYNTVKNHLYSLFKKIGVRSRSQMIYKVVESRSKQEKWEK